MEIFSDSFTKLEKALDYSTMKQKVIANNIANADTPNYKAKDVSFKKIFEQTVASEINTNRSDPRHYDLKSSSSQSGIINKRGLSFNENGNSVDVDKEMSDLATNQIYYNAMTDRLSGRFQSLTNVIKGGR